MGDDEQSPGLPEATFNLRLAGDPDSSWQLEHARLAEGLSELYEHELDVVTDNPFPDARALLGTRVTLTIGRDGHDRPSYGIIRGIEDRERMRDGRWALRLFVAPELWLLSKRRDTRIFPHRDVPQIVREVLDAAGLYPGQRLVLHLHREDRAPTHATREYCVQYQETDLAFVQRLLEEEGTSFLFRHDGDDVAEKLVLADGDLGMSDAAFPPIGTTRERPRVRLVAPGELTLCGEEAVTHMAARTEIRSTAVTLHDADFTRYGRRGEVTHESDVQSSLQLPVYEHEARFVPDELSLSAGQPAESAVLGLLSSLAEGFVQGAGGGLIGGEPLRLLDGAIEQTLRLLPPSPLPRHATDTGSRLASIRLEEERCSGHAVSGRGNVLGMAAGSFFELEGHPRHELDGPYLVRRVRHELHAPDHLRGGERIDPSNRYSNSFECIPRSVVHRPARSTPRPKIHGTQTAIVVGGADEEIHVDSYGRVRVQFHWDRQHACHDNLGGANAGALERHPSLVAWARCAQSWAGPSWGSVFIPRIGMEVVVTFEDGDPDRPLVVGCVYNAANPPPYDLPGNYHRSTIRSRSIPSAMKPGGREGYNEIRFDDLAESEEIFVHAEKDLTEVVRNHHETWIGGGQDVEVMMHQSNRVVGSQRESVGGNQTVTVGGKQDVTVAHQRSVEVHGTDRHFSGGGRITETSDFGADLVRGIHVHHVTAATDPSPVADRDVDVVYRAIGRVLDGRAAGRLVDPYGGVDEAPTSDTSTEGSSTAAARHVPLETYVVRGDRLKKVTGFEEVRLAHRSTSVAIDDQLDVVGRWGVSAGESASVVVHGVDSADAKGLSMQTEPSRLDLFLAGQGLRMTPGTLRLRQGGGRLVIDGDGLMLGAKAGAVRIHLGEDTTDHGLHVEDDGDTVRLASSQSTVEVTTDICLDANGKVVVSASGARITLANGDVEIEGTNIVFKGKVRTE